MHTHVPYEVQLEGILNSLLKLSEKHMDMFKNYLPEGLNVSNYENMKNKYLQDIETEIKSAFKVILWLYRIKRHAPKYSFKEYNDIANNKNYTAIKLFLSKCELSMILNCYRFYRFCTANGQETIPGFYLNMQSYQMCQNSNSWSRFDSKYKAWIGIILSAMRDSGSTDAIHNFGIDKSMYDELLLTFLHKENIQDVKEVMKQHVEVISWLKSNQSNYPKFMEFMTNFNDNFSKISSPFRGTNQVQIIHINIGV